MHILPCLVRLYILIGGRFHLLDRGFYRSCHVVECHFRQALACCHGPNNPRCAGRHTARMSDTHMQRPTGCELYSPPCMSISLRLSSEWCRHAKSESCRRWKSLGNARPNTRQSQSCSSPIATHKHFLTTTCTYTILSQPLFRIPGS